MENDIKLIIEKNLPQQVGDALKKVLEKAEQDARTVEYLNSEIASMRIDLGNKQDVINDYQRFDNRNSSLDVREMHLNELENSLKVKELEYQLACEKEKTDFTRSVALGLVRNIEFRKESFSNGTVPFREHGALYYDSSSTSNSEKSLAE